MQMYDGLPIITNKITVEEQQGIPHHLLGFIPLDDEPSRVGLFKKQASKIIQEIRSRGRLPIVVGGTHYYTQALLFRDSLVSDRDVEGPQDAAKTFPILDESTDIIWAKLNEVDPVMANRWHINERRKIRRSLEIYLQTGKKASDIYSDQKENKSVGKSTLEYESTLLFWVHSDAEALEKRLFDRVDKMIETGLLDEVKSMDAFLHERARSGINVDRGRGIWVSIGWKEFESYLDTLRNEPGCKDLKRLYEDSVERTKIATRQYANYQIKWIRRKLMLSLFKDDILQKLYLLDGTHIPQWNHTVSQPALEITGNFLAGNALPSPTALSATAQKFLDSEQFREKMLSKTDFRRVCETCEITILAEVQWANHVESRAHRARLKKLQRQACPGFQKQTQHVAT